MTADVHSVLFDFSHRGSEVRRLVFDLLNAVAAESQSVLRFLHDRAGRVTLNRDPLPGQRASWLAVRYSSALLWASRALMVYTSCGNSDFLLIRILSFFRSFMPWEMSRSGDWLMDWCSDQWTAVPVRLCSPQSSSAAGYLQLLESQSPLCTCLQSYSCRNTACTANTSTRPHKTRYNGLTKIQVGSLASKLSDIYWPPVGGVQVGAFYSERMNIQRVWVADGDENKMKKKTRAERRKLQNHQ